MTKRLEFIINTICLSFSLYTMTVHICTLGELNFNQLKYLAFLPIILGLSLSLYLDHRQLSEPVLTDSADREEKYHGIGPLALAALIVLFSYLFYNLRLLWVLSVIFLLVLYLKHLKISCEFKLFDQHNKNGSYFLVLSILILSLLTISANRPDPDDANLLNIVITCLDHADQPLHSHESIHGISHLPIQMQVRRILSFEPLVALTASLFNISPHFVYYLTFPIISVILHVLILYLFLSLLFNKNWIFVFIGLEIILFSLGHIHRSYGNFAYVRLFQGKSVFVTVVIPLIMYYGLRFSSSINKTKYLILLTATQISAIGLTVTALWAGPLISGLTLLSCWRPNQKQTSRLFFGLLSSCYPLILGLYLKTLMGNQIPIINNLPSSDFPEYITKVLGSGPILWIQLLALTGGSTQIQKQETRRFFIAYALFYLVFCLNPFLMEVYKKFITGPSPYWRMLWLAPIPILSAVLFSGPIVNYRTSKPYILLRVALIIMLIPLVFSLLNVTPTLSSKNNTTLGFPGYKMNVDDYNLAEFIDKETPGDSFILAPTSISYIIATLPGHSPLIAVRSDYLNYLSPWMTENEYIARKNVFEFISGVHRDGNSVDYLNMIFKTHNIGFVVVSKSNPWLDDINKILRKNLYERVENTEYYLWRKQTKTSNVNVVLKGPRYINY